MKLTMQRTRALVVLLPAVAVLLAATAHAQLQPIFDHLKCYKIRDFRTIPSLSTADLIPEQMPPFAKELGCTIKGGHGAAFFCIDVEKTNVMPTPPLNVVGVKAQDYLCYNLTCPKPSPMPTLGVVDQFGQGGIVVKQPKYLCAPAFKAPSPTPPPPTPAPSPTPCPRQCLGATNTGAPCNTDTQCGGAAGSCGIPPCCCSPPGMPACVTTADCPVAGSVCICP